MWERQKRDFIRSERQRRANRQFVQSAIANTIKLGEVVASGVQLAMCVPIIGVHMLWNGTKAVGSAVLAVPGAALQMTMQGVGKVGQGIADGTGQVVGGVANATGKVVGGVANATGKVVGATGNAALQGAAAAVGGVATVGGMGIRALGKVTQQSKVQVWNLQDSLANQQNKLAASVGLKHAKVKLNSKKPKSFVVFNMKAFQSIVNSQLQSDIVDIFSIEDDSNQIEVTKDDEKLECTQTRSKETDLSKIKRRARRCMRSQLQNVLASTTLEAAVLETFEYKQDKNVVIRQISKSEQQFCKNSNDCLAIQMKFPVKIEVSTSETKKLRKRDKFKNGLKKIGNFFGGNFKYKVTKKIITTYGTTTESESDLPETDDIDESYAEAIAIVSWQAGKIHLDIMDNIDFKLKLDQLKVEINGEERDMPVQHPDHLASIKNAIQEILTIVIKRTVNQTFNNELEKVILFDKTFKNVGGQTYKRGLPISFSTMDLNQGLNFMTMSVNINDPNKNIGQQSRGQRAISELQPVGNTIQQFVNESALSRIVDYLITTNKLYEIIRNSIGNIVNTDIDWNDLSILPLNFPGKFDDNHKSYIQFRKGSKEEEMGTKSLNSGVGIKLVLQTVKYSCLKKQRKPVKECTEFVFNLDFTISAHQQNLLPEIDNVEVWNHKDEGSVGNWISNLWNRTSGQDKVIAQENMAAVEPIARWIVERIGTDFEFMDHRFLYYAVDNIDGMMRIVTSIERTFSEEELEQIQHNIDAQDSDRKLDRLDANKFDYQPGK